MMNFDLISVSSGNFLNFIVMRLSRMIFYQGKPQGKQVSFFLKFTLFCCLFVGNGVCADTVRLKNGDIVSGHIISYQDGICVFNTIYNANLKLNTDDIHTVATDDVYNVTFSSGEIAVGRLTYAQGKTVMESSTFGSIEVDASSIKSLVRNFSIKTDASDSVVVPDKSFGEDVSKQAPLDFLEGATVLLAPGQYEVDFGFSYKQFREAYSLPAAGYFQRSAYTARQMMFNIGMRAGIHEGIEGWINIPYTYSYIEQVSTNAYVRDEDAWDLGDISFGLQYQLSRETTRLPAVSTTFAVSAPTGRKKYYDLSNTWRDPLNNGNGHWGVSTGLSFVRTTDPAILFGGINFRYFFPNTISGYRVKPGLVESLYFGVGFALNEKLSVGSRFSYTHKSNMKVDGEKIYGSDMDPMDITLSASYRFYGEWVATPQVTFNLNDDAGTPGISLLLKRQFD